MDSWTLQGDSYSFLRSAPRTFSLCHRDGTPNHVEIIDIINTPSQRSAISETTCLCDIFGDNGESSSLSSSPAVGPFVFSQREVDGTAAASPLLDDLNESSGSYHSAQGISEGEDIFEDSRERLYSPPLQSESSDKSSPEVKSLSSGQAEVTGDSIKHLHLSQGITVHHLIQDIKACHLTTIKHLHLSQSITVHHLIQDIKACHLTTIKHLHLSQSITVHHLIQDIKACHLTSRQGEANGEGDGEGEKEGGAASGKGEGLAGDVSYRGEQVELSFNARNRKGPVSRRAAPTSGETRQGLPALHSFSESLLATKQLQQQQSPQRFAYQQDTRGGSTGRRLQPPAPQNKKRSPGRATEKRPCQSSSSSMGSEIDDADNEVKWFTDEAFSSLSSPEVDYLDMYNSSHRSSTNISQPSTQESSAGVNAAWMAYADFRGSAPKLDNDEHSIQQASLHFSDGLDPSRHFECIDVAMEREDSRRVRRGVPKRQIQLKRKDTAEGKQDGSSENSSPGVLMMMESPPFESHAREMFARQHSTPAELQECYSSECSSDCNQQNERKPKLQKSSSLDNTCNKGKKTTCFFKNVLSKKMTSADKDFEAQERDINQTFDDNSSQIENAALGVSPKLDAHNLSSSLQSEYSLSSEGPSMRGEPSSKDDAKPPTGFGVRSGNRPSSSSSSRSFSFSQTESEEADSQSRNLTSSRSATKGAFDSKQSSIGVQQADHGKSWNRREAGNSANATAWNRGAPSDTGAPSTQARMTTRDQECENTEGYKQLQQGGKGISRLKTQEITLKAVEKKKASLNVCLTHEAENKPEASAPDVSLREKEERAQTSVKEKTKEEEGNVNNQAKAPIHKVRDVRQLVKNKYNLSFKATGAVTTSTLNEDRIGNINGERSETIQDEKRKETKAGEKTERKERRQEMKENVRAERKDGQKEEMMQPISPLPQSSRTPSQPQPMQIKCQAVCWKENTNEMLSSMKDSDNPGGKPQTSLKLATESDAATVKLGQKDIHLTEEHKVPDNEDNPAIVGTYRKPPMLGNLPRLPSKEREVSTAVVLIRDGSRKTKTITPAALEEAPHSVQAPAASPSPGLPTAGNIHARSSHSVSTLLKEKGFQADIGAVVGGNQNAAGGTGLACKHVNCLEIPLQTATTSDGRRNETERERTFSSSSAMSGPSALCDNNDTLTKTKGNEGTNGKRATRHTAEQTSPPLLSNAPEQTPNKQKALGDFEAIKRMDPTFPPKSPAIRRLRPQSIEVKSLSKATPQTIEVKSTAKSTQKPAVPPKPSCKFKPADVEAMPNEEQKPPATTSTVKPQGEERSQTIVVSSPTIYRKISNESASNYTRKLSVSTISSLKPPPLKTTTTTTTTAMSNVSNQPTAPPETEASHDRGQQQKTGTLPQGSSYIHRPTTLATAPISATGPGLPKSADPALEPKQYQLPGPASAGPGQPSQPTVMDPALQLQHPRMPENHGQAVSITSNNKKPPSVAPTTRVPGYTHQPCRRSLSSDHPHRTDGRRFYGSDDPPSYDERESFSPLMLPDLTPRRSNRYQASSGPPPCSCTTGCPSHPGLIPPHHHRSPHSLTPPAPPHSPGQALPYAVVQPPHRPHQCRSDPQQMSHQLCSPKSSPLGPNQPPTIYQPLHQPPPCPPHPSLMQPCHADHPLQPPQHIDSRRPPVHRSPQQHPSGMAPYNDPGRSHSPGLPSVDPQYLCGPQSLGPTYGSEYGGDTSSLYSESSYGQTPRRVLLDPETGKYFYIEVPVQPLRKMLFDPETGQYVEVLIPQQAMSHSGLYPPSAAPYPSLHNPNMYAPSPQYMPYAAPPPPAHAQAQPPRYPETSAAPTMHPIGAGVNYRNPSGQASKPESLNHPTLDQNYLDSMYYVPTGMSASANPTPPDYYHKNPSNLPPTGGERS
ncbi:LOW QUALITY PROTEIN: protein split ends [Brachionichthys hirsutus]|uniref:LOW QUALITY PROTEIN: protein split ends n=1 Tax=Brachionichthys hirsutus TaxID=412623 RepID=UPI003604E402